METDDPGYRDKAEESQTGFQEARTWYGELVGEDEGRGSEIDAFYREYAPLSETMMDENDEKEAAQTQVSEGYAGFRASLGDSGGRRIAKVRMGPARERRRRE